MTSVLETRNAAIAEPITKPGVYDIPNDMYQADPVKGGSLSNSGARRLLPPSCPAKFKYERDHGRKPKREYELGHAAHKLVLGVGEEIVVIKTANYKTKAAQEEQAAARAEGKVPLLEAEHDVVKAMAAALRADELAAALLQPGTGTPEQSLFWRDSETGVIRRARLDWLRTNAPGRLWVVDYKTCNDASHDALERAANDYGYFRQSRWYLDGVTALGLGDDPRFAFIHQEKTPPYLVHVVEPTALALEAGGFYNRKAIRLYAECVRTDTWPGYSADAEHLTQISLPPWAQTRYFQESGS